jgi:hypothetical protein
MYLYDETLGVHIHTSPLLVSNRVLKAARDIDPEIQLEWDENGFVCGITHSLSVKISEQLGIRTLNVQGFMGLSRRHPEMMSEEFSEWLSNTYRVCEDETEPLR